MLSRVYSTLLGAAAGAMLYLGFDLLGRHGLDHWSIHGPVRWCALIGALVGLIGGPAIAERLWSTATDDVRDDATWTIGMGTVMIVFAIVVGVGLYCAAG
ncbi:MAG TPA: hypothetical protein VLA61_09980 [Ideonella sp.]|uniref:hypothetical protein n=1 Tax=Ideonella sp. TaxID=1929293 RepID=UPI002BBC078F|nr:hypothetical protein [Ideonella sp.]HSI48588.1 hypothetical protein [Ideonella sp.]